MRHGAYGVMLAALWVAGCASPRLIESNPSGGCVAIADNSDTWPCYHRSKALDLMQKQCPAGYKIVQEKEVVVGQTTTNSTQSDTTEVPIAKGFALDVQQKTRNTTEVRDRTEWRIWYQKN